MYDERRSSPIHFQVLSELTNWVKYFHSGVIVASLTRLLQARHVLVVRAPFAHKHLPCGYHFCPSQVGIELVNEAHPSINIQVEHLRTVSLPLSIGWVPLSSTDYCGIVGRS